MPKIPAILFYAILMTFALDTYAAGGADIKAAHVVKRRSEILKDSYYDLSQLPLYAKQLMLEDGDQEWRMSLEEVTKMVLHNNIDIKISYLNLDRSRRGITQSRAVFDPTTALSLGLGRTRTPDVTGQINTPGDTVAWSATMTKRIETGGTITLDFDHNRTGKDRHLHTSDLGMTISQPLLDGFGRVSLAPIRISQNNYSIAVEDLRGDIISQISRAQRAYWEILNSQEALKAREVSRRQAGELLEQNRKELDLGNRTFTDVLQAEATAASREENVLAGENQLADDEDELKRLLNAGKVGMWEKRIVITDKLEADFEPVKLDVEECIMLAFKHRPDYQRALQRLANEEINLMVAKNDLLPDLDLVYDYNFNGAGDSSRDNLNVLMGGHFQDWNLSLSLNMPWLDRDDREEFQRQKNLLKRRELEIRDLQVDILKAVRGAVREVQTDIKRMEAAELAFQLQAKKLEAEKKKYDLGLSTSFQVLEFQEDLVNASVARIRSIVDYHQSLISLWEEMGVTLEKNNVVFAGT